MLMFSLIKYCKLGVRLDYITGNVNWYVHINIPPSVWSIVTIYTYHYDSIPSLNLPSYFRSSLPLPPPPRSFPLPLLTCSLMLSTMCCISDSWVGTVWRRSRPAWSVAMQVRTQECRYVHVPNLAHFGNHFLPILAYSGMPILELIQNWQKQHPCSVGRLMSHFYQLWHISDWSKIGRNSTPAL